MKDKNKGFTLIEVIITLAITVIVLGVIYAFSFTNQKMLSSTQINAELQDQGRDIENSFVEIGMQAKSIETVNNTDAGTDNKYKSFESNNNKLKIAGELTIKSYDINTYTFKLNGTVLELIKNVAPTSIKTLSKNVKTMEIRPLDINTVSDKNNSFFANAPGIEVSIMLYKKQGLSEITYPVSTIVKFRNKDVI